MRRPSWRIKVLVDGGCPLCRREGDFLLRLDGGRGRLAIEDIAAADLDPGSYGATRPQLLGQIHGVLPDGRLVRGMEVFRRAYAAVGLGWLLAPTGWPVLRTFCDAAYSWFARHRYRLTQ